MFWAPSGPAAREARRPHFVRRRASKPARALRSLRRPPHLWGLVCWRMARPPCVALKPSCGCQPAIPHVIPLRLVQTLNSWRWNYNVFGVSRKVTTINYVRHLGGGGVVAAMATQPGPRVSSGALHTCGAGLLMCGSARWLVVRPGPAAARGRRSLALSTRWPGCLKPSSPLLAGTRVGLKPPIAVCG